MNWTDWILVAVVGVWAILPPAYDPAIWWKVWLEKKAGRWPKDDPILPWAKKPSGSKQPSE